LERHLIGDRQLVSTAGGSRKKDLADIDAEAVNPKLLGPSAKHFAFAAGQVQHALAWLKPTNRTQCDQFLVTKRIQNAMICLSDFVLSK
jgi:hypothetical protein